jgi:hypothetical protein
VRRIRLRASPRATLTRDYAILLMLGRSYWPMLAMLGLPYTGYAHAILCWCFILANSDSNTGPRSQPIARRRCFNLLVVDGQKKQRQACRSCPRSLKEPDRRRETFSGSGVGGAEVGGADNGYA